MPQNAFVDNIVLQNIEQRQGQSGYPYAMLTIMVNQRGKGGDNDPAITEVMCGKPEIFNSLQVGATYSMEFEARVGKPHQQTGKRFLNLNLKNCNQTGGAAQNGFNQAPAQGYNQSPPPQNYNQAPPAYNQAPANGYNQAPPPLHGQAPVQNQAPMQQAPVQNQAPQQGFAPPQTQTNSAPEDFDDDIPF